MDPRLAELLTLWDQKQNRGESVAADDHCATCPELLPAFRRVLAERSAASAPDSQATMPPAPPVDHSATLPPPAPNALDSATLPPSISTVTIQAATVNVPGYDILGELGRGGMGVVYRAKQQRPHRTVALKMVLAGAHASSQDLIRFLAEAEAIAKLRHANIVQIYEFGKHGEQPYFSLEFCEGGSLAGKLAGTPLKAREAAELIATLAEAVQAAHDAGIVHRDLKPHNVLLLADGTPKITDFGLAKQAGSDLTASGAIMGTPSYMAPEQADPRRGNIGPEADVYALGAILYECLTGRPPFRAATPLDTILQVVNDEPVAPRQLNPQAPRDLETIALKCLQKDPKKRYPTAAALSQDLHHFLNDEPIAARAVGRFERFTRWCRKSPWRAAALFGCAALLGLSIGLLISMVQSAEQYGREVSQALSKAVAEKDRADKESASARKREQEAKDALDSLQIERDKAMQFAYATNVSGAFADWQISNSHRARQLLDACDEKLRGWEWSFLRQQFEESSLPLRGHTNGPLSVIMSPDGSKVCTMALDKTVRIWDANAGAELHSIPVQARFLALSPDGKRLAIGASSVVLVLDADSERELQRFKVADLVVGIGFVRGGAQLGVATLGGEVAFHDPANGNIVAKIPERLTLDRTTRQYIDIGLGMTFSPDGQWLAQGGDSKFRVWEAATGKLHWEGIGHIKLVGQVAFHPNSKILASPGGEGDVRLWDIEKKELLRTLKGHRAWAWRVAWSGDGKRLISCAKDTTARIWDPETGDALLTLRGHGSEVWGCALSADGLRAATASPDGTARIWDTRDRVIYGEHVQKFFRDSKVEDFGRHGPAEFLTFYGHVAPSGTVALSADGRLAATSAMGDDEARHQITVWDLDGRRELMKIPGKRLLGHTLTFSPDGKYLAIGSGSSKKGEPSQVRVVMVPEGKQVWEWTGPSGRFPHVKYSPNGRQLNVALQAHSPQMADVSADGKAWLVGLDAAMGQEQYRQHLPGTATRASYSPDGTEIVVANTTGLRIHVYDAATGKEKRAWDVPGTGVSDVVCGPKGIVAVAVVAVDGSALISLWNLSDGQKLRELEGHVGIVMQMAFSPDGKRLFSTASDFSARLWNVDTGRELLTMRDHVDVPLGVAWSADGRRVATAGKDGALRVWTGPPTETAENSEWKVLYQNDYSDTKALEQWTSNTGLNWEVRDGALRGRHVQRIKPATFTLADGVLKGIELPRHVEVSFRYRMSAPMVIVAEFSRAGDKTQMYAPLLASKCKLAGSPFAFIMKLSYAAQKPEDIAISQVGVPRKFDAEAGRWYRVRILREPKRMTVWVDDSLLLRETLPNVDLPQLGLQGSWASVGDIIEFDDLVIKGRADAIREQELRVLVQDMFAKAPLREEVVRRLTVEMQLNAAEQAIVERIALEFREDPQKLADAAWEMVVSPDRTPEQYALALKQSEASVRAEPNNDQFLSHLGLARLRAGQYDQAVADARHALELTRARAGAGWPVHHAVLAMAHHKLGKTAEAADQLQRLRDLMRGDHWASRKIAQGFLRETEALLQPKPATPLEKDVDAIKHLIFRAEQDGWSYHDLAGYWRAFAADATNRSSRMEAAGPHDVVTNRQQLEGQRRIYFRTPPTDDGLHQNFEDVQVEIKGEEAELRCRTAVQFGDNFEVYLIRYELRRGPQGWKVKSTHSWIVAAKEGAEIHNFDAKKWAELDAVADGLKDDPDLQRRIQALQKARRFGDGYALALEGTKDENAPADLWRDRGDLAFNLGKLDDARAAFKKAEELDPEISLPWYASRLRRTYRSHGVGDTAVAFLPDGKRIFSAGGDGFGRLWDAATGKELRQFADAKAPLFAAAVSPDGKLCAAGNDTVHVWELETGKLLMVGKGHQGNIRRLHFSPDGQRLLSSGTDNVARHWEIATGKVLAQIGQIGGEVLFSPDGKSYVVSSRNGQASLHDIASDRDTLVFAGHQGEVKRLAISQDGTKLATSDDNLIVRIWDAKTGKKLHVLAGHKVAIGALHFSPDGSRLAVADSGGNIRIWNVESGKMALQLRSEGAGFATLSFSPDGRTLAAGSQGGVHLWDLQPDPLGE